MVNEIKNGFTCFEGITQTFTPDNFQVAVPENKDWINPSVNVSIRLLSARRRKGYDGSLAKYYFGDLQNGIQGLRYQLS